MNYAVIPLTDPGADFLEIINGIDSGAYVDYAPKVYFVRFKGTPASLSVAVGFDSESPTDGIVIASKDYNGYANADLWGWLEQ